MTPAFLETEYPPSPAEKAGFHIIPAPLERSVCYGGGTAMGPAAIIAASQQLEAWDGITAPGTIGIHTCPPVDCLTGSVEEILARIEAAVGAALDAGAIPVVLGGEHTVSYGPLRAFSRRTAASDLGIVHIDAHCDLHDVYHGDRYSHACVLRRVHEDCGFALAQFATRDFAAEELDYRRHATNIFWMDGSDLSHGIPEKPLPDSFPRDIYVTFDVDGLDSSVMPCTGTPSPGGLSWWGAIHLLENCLHGRRMVGFDVVELAPVPGLHHCDFTAAKLVLDLMAMACRSRQA